MMPADCPLCLAPKEQVLWHNARLRVIKVDDDHYPGFTRVIWHEHIAEMTQLPSEARLELMNVVWLVEQAQRSILKPDKINLAQFGNMVPHLHWHVIPRWKTDSHFPEAIWATAPTRSPQQVQAWQAEKMRIKASLPRYHLQLSASLACASKRT